MPATRHESDAVPQNLAKVWKLMRPAGFLGFIRMYLFLDKSVVEKVLYLPPLTFTSYFHLTRSDLE